MKRLPEKMVEHADILCSELYKKEPFELGWFDDAIQETQFRLGFKFCFSLMIKEGYQQDYPSAVASKQETET